MHMYKHNYPYKLYISGSPGFNNYFLFMHYINKYKNEHTFLYSPKPSMIDVMSRMYATLNNLCHLSCNVDKCLQRYQNAAALDYKIASETDMLIGFWDGSTPGIKELARAFESNRKPVSIIDITGSDAIIPGTVQEIDNSKPSISFAELYGKYIDTDFKADTYTESAMKFLSDIYRNKDLMKLVIDNKDKELITKDKLELSIKALLYWIYNNAFSTLEDDYNTLTVPDEPDRKKRFTLKEYKHAKECVWSKHGEEKDVYTGTGLLLAHGYHRVIEFGNKSYLEINSNQIIRAHIHKSMASHLYTEVEDDCNKITYRTSDTESYPITYQVANFENCEFKMGYYYISTDFVTTVKPEEKQTCQNTIDGQQNSGQT